MNGWNRPEQNLQYKNDKVSCRHCISTSDQRSNQCIVPGGGRSGEVRNESIGRSPDFSRSQQSATEECRTPATSLLIRPESISPLLLALLLGLSPSWPLSFLVSLPLGLSPSLVSLLLGLPPSWSLLFLVSLLLSLPPLKAVSCSWHASSHSSQL